MKKKLDTAITFFSFSHSVLTRLTVFFLFLPSLIFLGAIFVVNSIIHGVKEETAKMTLPSQIFSNFTPAPYPFVSTDVQNALFTYRTTPSLSASSAIIMDNDSKIILFAKNKDIRFSMASTVKIMTALVALDHFRQADILTIRSGDVPPAIVGFVPGEQVRFFDMLYGLLLPSGNDAALAIAQNYPGGESAFIAKMNQKAKALHLKNTHFSDSSGLDDAGDYTTVGDLVRLTSLALENPTFRQIVSTKKQTIPVVNSTKKYTVTNLNQLLGSYDVIGVKTGFTPDAGGILATASKNKDHTLLFVVMKSDDRFLDTEKLLSTVYNQVGYTIITP